MEALAQFVGRISDIGVAGQSAEGARRIRTINVIALLGGIVTLTYCVFYALYDARLFQRELIFLLIMVGLYCTIYFVTRAGKVEAAMWLLIAFAIVHLGIVGWMLGARSGSLIYLLAVPFIVSLVVADGDRLTMWPIAVLAAIIFFVIRFSETDVPFDTLPELTKRVFFFTCTVGTISLGAVISLFFRRLIERAEASLQLEKARGDRLLRAILPDAIAEELKQDEGRVIANQVASATVVFADIVGFTERSARTDPTQLVSDLNAVFSRADELAARHGIEKIKTIGDAYLAVCGLPDPVEDHAERAADFALDLLAAIEELGSTVWPGLRLRIVVHTGPMVAGVIGRTKFAYDVWGDTVNTAARMEDVCKPGEILLSEETQNALPSRFTLESGGTVELKDKGQMAVHRLVGNEVMEPTSPD